jgi:uncharacterized protein
MILCDVNVLIYAFRKDTSEHATCSRWLQEEVLNAEGTYCFSEIVLAAVLRIVTNHRIFVNPSRLEVALEFCRQIREQPNAVAVSPGPRHWEIFSRLARDADTKGSLITDAYLAALAIESGSEWITTDRDYARFKGLRWRHPID